MFTRPIIALRRWGAGETARRLRALLPRPLRSMLHRAKTSIDNIPLRIVLPPPGRQAPVRVAVFGSFADNWLARLSEPQTWRACPAVAEIVLWPDDPAQPFPEPSPADLRTVVIALSEDNILNRPPSLAALAPDRRAVATLRNKASFAAYVAAEGLGEVCPVTYTTRAQVAFPCIVKYVTAAFGFGSRILRSDRELDDFLRGEPWDGGKFIVQQCLAGPVEYATHCVCKAGRILWSATLAFENEAGQEIRRGIAFKSMTAVASPAVAVAAIERLLLPLRYDGPCSVDYTLLPAGRIAVYEINARFGGTLMLAANRAALQQALACIVDNAAVAGGLTPGESEPEATEELAVKRVRSPRRFAWSKSGKSGMP